MYKYKVGEDGGHGRMWTFAPERVMDAKDSIDSIVDGIFLSCNSVFSYDVQIFDGQEVRRAGR